MATSVTLKYSKKELRKAFKKLGVSNVNFEDEEKAAGTVNALLVFLDQDSGFDLFGTEVVVGEEDDSICITLERRYYRRDCNQSRFFDGIRALQEFMSKVAGKKAAE